MMRLIRLGSLVLGIMVLLATITVHVARTQGSTAQFVVFVDNARDDFVYNIYRQNIHESRRHLLVEDIVGGSVHLSPDGRWMSYAETHYPEPTKLYRMRLDGSGRQVIAEIFGAIRDLRWSPNGQWIAFVITEAYDTADYGLYRVRVDGTHFEKIASALTFNTSYPYGLSWSPDSEWLAYSKALDHLASFPELYRIRVNGTDEQLLMNDERTSDPLWSPDGEWMVVTRRWFDEYGLGMSGLFRIRADGSDLQPLTAGFDNVGLAILSPDQRWVAFSVNYNEQSDIYRMRLDGSGLEQLTDTAFRESVVEWLPNGWIVFIRYGDGEPQMFRMQADGSAVEPLSFPHAGLRNVQWSPVIDLDWGPSGLGIGGLVLLGISGWTMLPRKGNRT